MRHILKHIREALLDIAYERRAAGAGQEALFDELAALRICDHIRAERRLDNGMEAERLESGDDLSELGIRELARDRGCDKRIDLVLFVVLTLLDKINSIKNERLVHDSAERALIYARTAGDALLVVDGCSLILVHMYSLDLAGILAGTLTADDSGVGADLCTSTALLALTLVDVSDMMLVRRDSAEAAGILAAVCKTAAACIGDLISAHRALVAGALDDLDDVGVILVSAHSELYSLSENGSLLIDAAAHCGSVSGDDHFRNVHDVLHQAIIPSETRDLAEDLVFQMLYLCVKLV